MTEEAHEKEYDMVVTSGEESGSESEASSDDSAVVTKRAAGTEEAERIASREKIENRSRMWQVVGSSDEEEKGDDDMARARDGDSISKRKLSHESDPEKSNYGHSGGGDREAKRQKKEKKSKKDSKKGKKSKKDKKSKKEKKSKKGKKSKKENSRAINQDQWGKYGIVQLSDRFKKAREFEAWCIEVKNAPGIVHGAQWEVNEYFKEYMEDFNTSTLPHRKFYNYDSWEKEDYEKRMAKESKKKMRTRTEFNDEDDTAAARRRQRDVRRAELLDATIATMDDDKIDEMKNQKLLISEMQEAYKRGDTDKVAQIQKRLDADLEDSGRWGKYTAPDNNLRI